MTQSSSPSSPLSRRLSKQAAKELVSLHKSQPKHARQVAFKIETLLASPYPNDSKKLQNNDDLYRVDVGEMRIIYNDKNRIWLNPAKKEAAIIDKALNGETLWGKSYKIYDINDLKMGVASHHAQAYIVTFNQAADRICLGRKLGLIPTGIGLRDGNTRRRSSVNTRNFAVWCLPLLFATR